MSGGLRRETAVCGLQENTEGSLAPPQAEGRDTPPAAVVRGVAVCRFAFPSGAVPTWPKRGTAQLVKAMPTSRSRRSTRKGECCMAQVFIGSTTQAAAPRPRASTTPRPCLRCSGPISRPGLRRHERSDGVRRHPHGELEFWCPAERSVDTTRRLGRLGRWPDVAGPRPPDRRYHGPSL